MPSINIIFPSKPPISILGVRKKHIHAAIANGVSKALKVPLEHVRIYMTTRADVKRVKAELYVMKGHTRQQIDAARIAVCSGIADRIGINVNAGSIDFRLSQMENRDHTVGGLTPAALSAHIATKRRKR